MFRVLSVDCGNRLIMRDGLWIRRLRLANMLHVARRLLRERIRLIRVSYRLGRWCVIRLSSRVVGAGRRLVWRVLGS